MRILLLSIALSLSLSPAFAQHTGNWDDTLIGRRQWEVPPLPYNGVDIVYSENVPLVPAVPKEELFANAKNWLRNNLKTDFAQITEESVTEGKIRGEGEIYYNQAVLANGAPQSIFFSYDINVTNNSYSYKIYDLVAKVGDEKFKYADMYREEQKTMEATRWTHKYRYEMLSDMDSFLKLFIAGLKNGIMTP